MLRIRIANLRSLILVLLLFFESSLPSEEILVFYHLPKCGGTTVASLIGQQFSNEQIYRDVIPESQDFAIDNLGPLSLKGVHLLPLDRIDLTKVKYIHGHLTYSKEHDLPGAKNFTFLRDPVQRVFSSYRYAQSKIKLDFLAQYNQLSNLQVMRLSALPKNDPNIPLKEHLESAKEVLSENFFFVGIAEEMTESLHALFKLMNWDPPNLTPAFNTTKTIDPSSYEFYSYVYEQEWADRELYAFAKLLFQEHQKTAKNLNLAPKKIEYVDTIHFSANSALSGEGWGYRELDQETNTTLRLSYTTDAFIRFPLLQKTYIMEFKAFFPSQEVRKKFQLLINGKKIACKQTSGGKWETFTAFIPKKLISKEETTITFHLSNLYVPAEQENSLGLRTIGIGISYIHITPK